MVFPLESHIRLLCGNFIRIIRNKIYLVHETAREFLLERTQTNLGDSPSVIIRGVSTRTWSSTTTAAFDDFDHARERTAAELGWPSSQTEAFLEYTAKSWTIHFHQVSHRLAQSNFVYYYNLCHPNKVPRIRVLDHQILGASRKPAPAPYGL
jgi:protein SERAC1